MQTIQRSFTGGEIAPSLRSRADIVKYLTGLALCENMFVRSQGGCYSRPGTRFIGSVSQPDRRPRLIPFSFNTTQTYILVFEHLTMRVIKDGGFVLDGAGPSLFELVTPYTEDQLSRLSFVQDADVMTIVHPDHDPSDLSRTADDEWSLDAIVFDPPIDPPVWGSPALTAVGSGAGSHTRTYSYAVTVVDINGVESIRSQTRYLDTASLSSTAGIALTWEPVVGAAYYRVYKDPSFGTGFFGWIGDSTTAGFIDYNIAPITSDAPPTRRNPFGTIIGTITDFDSGTSEVTSVSHGLVSGETVLIEGMLAPTNFNDLSFTVQVIDDDTFILINDLVGPIASYTSGGTFTRTGTNPSAVGYYQQRRVFANTYDDPQAVYTTQTGAYSSLRFSVPARDDDAVTFSIKGRQVNEIRHLVDIDGLVLLTSGAEWRITEGQDQVLTPSTVGARIQSYYGASWVPPQIVGDSIVFIQDKGARVRDLKYQFSDDKYTGTDLAIMAEHLLEGYAIEEMAYCQEPYSILWMVRDDGVLLGLTYQREHQVWAWHHHDMGGVVESVASISEGQRDALYMVVKRTIDGDEVRYVERMEPRITTGPEDVWCVDSGLQYEGAATVDISGLEHLEGEEVAVVADGNEVKNLVVDSGAITLPRAAEKVTVGLPFTATMILLDLDIGSATETIKGKEVSISRVIMEVEKSRGGWVGTQKDDDTAGEMTEIKPRYDTDGYGPLALKTFKQEVYVQPQWGLGGGLRIEQRAPFPLAVLSVIPDVDVG